MNRSGVGTGAEFPPPWLQVSQYGVSERAGEAIIPDTKGIGVGLGICAC